MPCLKCGSPVPELTGAGRPPTYCSTTCRRLAEFELRRLDRRIAQCETDLRLALADRTDGSFLGGVDALGRTKRQRVCDLRRWLRADEARLRELLGGAADA